MKELLLENMNLCDIILINFGGDLMKVIFLDFDGVINNWYHFDTTFYLYYITQVHIL